MPTCDAGRRNSRKLNVSDNCNNDKSCCVSGKWSAREKWSTKESCSVSKSFTVKERWSVNENYSVNERSYVSKSFTISNSRSPVRASSIC